MIYRRRVQQLLDGAQVIFYPSSRQSWMDAGLELSMQAHNCTGDRGQLIADAVKILTVAAAGVRDGIGQQSFDACLLRLGRCLDPSFTWVVIPNVSDTLGKLERFVFGSPVRGDSGVPLVSTPVACTATGLSASRLKTLASAGSKEHSPAVAAAYPSRGLWDLPILIPALESRPGRGFRSDLKNN